MDCEPGALVGAIYDAAVEPELWPTTLACLRQALGGEVSVLYCRDSTLTMRFCEVAATDGWTANMIAPYHNYYGSLDTRTPLVAATPPGQIYVDDRQMAFRAVCETEIFQDFFRPLGLGYGMAATLFRNGGRHGLISVHRSIVSGNFSPRAIELFEYLTPHVVRAMQVHRQVQKAKELANTLEVTLDHFPLAVALVNSDGDIRHMNEAACELLRQPNCPIRVRAHQLVAHDASSEQLGAHIKQALKLANGVPTSPAEILTLPWRDGSRTISIMISPLRDGCCFGLLTEPLAALFVSDPSNAIALDTSVLMKQFGLTTAEAAIAVDLAQGRGLREIAGTRRVTLETIRTQVKRLLAKTENRTQGQLIGKLNRSLALLRRRSSEQRIRQ